MISPLFDENGIIEVLTEVSVLPGAIVDLKIGGDDPVTQRQWGLELARASAEAGKLPGFDPGVHELVIPKTPFKTNTKEHQDDEGLHVTVVQGYGFAKEEIPENAVNLAGRKATVQIDMNTIRYLQGRPDNDEATGMVFYVAADVDAATKAYVNDLRREMGLGEKTGFWPHVSLAGIAPVGSRAVADIKMLRAAWAPPFPTDGSFPKPQDVLKLVAQKRRTSSESEPEPQAQRRRGISVGIDLS